MNLAEERGGGEIKQGEERIRKQEEEEDSSGTAAEEEFALGRNRLQGMQARNLMRAQSCKGGRGINCQSFFTRLVHSVGRVWSDIWSEFGV